MGVLKQVDGQTVGAEVTSDLSAKQFYAVKLSSGVLTTTFTKGNPVLGILRNKPNGATNKTIGEVIN